MKEAAATGNNTDYKDDYFAFEGGISELDAAFALEICECGICELVPPVPGGFAVAGQEEPARLRAVTSSIRDIAELVPYVRVRAVSWIRECNAAGLDPRISETYRTDARQAWLFAQGLTKVRLTGAHGFRVALDFFFVQDGKTAYPPVMMKAAADIAKRIGFAWGGDWVSFRDTPHLEMLGGVTLTQYRQGRRPTWYYDAYDDGDAADVEEVEKEMDQATFNKLADRYFAERAALPPSDWAVDDWSHAADKKIFDGSMPQAPLTREQAAAVLRRAGTI
jgi:peptidoglycan L-alanyl-D-glutamate endopeptidase CwlK